MKRNRHIHLIDIIDLSVPWSGETHDVVIIMPCTDSEQGLRTAEILHNRAGMGCTVLVVLDSVRQGFVKTLNQAASGVSAPYIVYLAQDAWPGRDWLRLAYETLEKSGKGLLGFNDGKWSGRIAAFGMVRSEWAKSLYGGALFHPAYRSHGADNELTVIARSLDMYEYNPHCILMEYDPGKDQGGSNQVDKELFQRRFIEGFDRLAPPERLASLAAEYNLDWSRRRAERGVSLVIPSRDGAHHLDRLLSTFHAVNTHQPVEILVVDQGSVDRTRDTVARYAGKGFTRLVTGGGDLSFHEACRHGLSRARYPFILFLKPDRDFTADLLPAALDRIEGDPAVGALGQWLGEDLETLPADVEFSPANLNRYGMLFCRRKDVLADLERREQDAPADGGLPEGEGDMELPGPPLPPGFSPDHAEPAHVTIVLYTRGNLESLRRCFASLSRHTDMGEHTFFVIDDSQDPVVADRISQWAGEFDFCQVLTCRERKGLCTALRELVGQVKWGDFCVIHDSAFLTPRWLPALKKAAYSDRRVGLASPVTQAHPFYTFRMNQGDTAITCARKLSLVSERRYPLMPLPDLRVFYLKYAVLARNPLPPFRHESESAYFLDYTAALAESGNYCILADDLFVHLSPPGETETARDRKALTHQASRKGGPIARILRRFAASPPRSLLNYAASEIRLDLPRKAAVFFGGLNLGGGTLVLVEFCNDLIMEGWDVVAVLLSDRRRESQFFDMLFEPLVCDDPREIASRLGNRTCLVATFWTTARKVHETALQNHTFIPYYFIQDFEVMFYDPQSRPNDPEERKNREAAGQSYRYNLRHLTTSDWIMERLRSFLGDPLHEIEKIGLGINQELFYADPLEENRSKSPLRIIAMARPRTPRRGFSDLLETLAIVQGQRKDVEMLLYGTDDLSAFDIPFPVRNLGVVSPGDLREHYGRSHIYIDTSLFQGYGLTGLEAMACGCACVITDSGGPSEYASHEYNALLAPPGDSQAQAEALLRLIDDGELRKKLAANGIETARRFSMHHAARDFDRLARKALAPGDEEAGRAADSDLRTIIVPVFNQLAAARSCLESILQHTDQPCRVIIVDDGSDSYTAAWLRQFAGEREQVQYLRNSSNLGFVESVNAGMRAAPKGDLVLLNSDTIVTPGWLSRLARCADSDPSIGIITPLSTGSSHLWIRPNPGETIFETARNIARLSSCRYPDVVTPEGWCFYIRRQVYEAQGGFDTAYGRGYCEESDYSMRALANGWRTVCCDDTFIFHEGMVTFRDQRGSRYRHNRERFDRRWRHYYQGAYRGFLTENPLRRLRSAHRALNPPQRKDPSEATVLEHRPPSRWIAEVAPPELCRRFREQAVDPSILSAIGERTSGEPRRVVFIIQQMEAYGGVLSVILLANDLIRLGCDVKVVVLTTKQYQEFPGLLTRPLCFDDRETLLEHFPEADVVVATLWTTVYVMAALFDRRPRFLPCYFVQDYEPHFYGPDEGEMRRLVEETYRLAPWSFAKTPWLCEKVRSLGVSITQVPPALDLEVFYPRDGYRSPSGVIRILTMLRPRTPQRGFETAVKVLKELSESRQDIEIHSFGCDDEDLRRENLPFALVNHGRVDNSALPELYSQAHIFAEFSHFHGFGRTIAEAMACGCPCVVTDSGGVSLFVRHEENALLAPPGDVDALLRHLHRLCDDEALRLRLASRARPSIEPFDRLHSARETLDFFRRCCSGEASR